MGKRLSRTKLAPKEIRALLSVAHDIRQSTLHMYGLAQLLAEQTAEDALHEQHLKMQLSAERMLRHIDRFLVAENTSQLSSLQLRPTNLAFVMQNITQALAPLARRYEKQLDVQYGRSIHPVLVSPIVTEQAIAGVLDTMICNTVGTPLDISVKNRASGVQIAVHDQTQAFPVDLMKTLVKKSGRAKRGSRHLNDTGYAMLAAQQIVHAMSGTFGVHSSTAGQSVVIDFPKVQQARLAV